jgi:polysaccharide biosynthesis protein PelA
VAFYGQAADESLLSSYDIAILDPMYQGSITDVASTGTRVCGYLSLGEIRTTDSYYDQVDPSALLEENPDWPDVRRIDVRNRSWSRLVIRQIIPDIVAKGFTGLLLDTLDTPPYLDNLDPISNGGMYEAAVGLVLAIRASHPDMFLIMNRGYSLLSSVIDSSDAVVAESLLTTPNNREGNCGYRWNLQSDVTFQLSLLAPAVNRPIPVPILSLDYWDPDDAESIRQIYLRQRLLGHHPYVATRVLDTIVAEPAA